jgi:hypothetical protein
MAESKSKGIICQMMWMPCFLTCRSPEKFFQDAISGGGDGFPSVIPGAIPPKLAAAWRQLAGKP